MRPLRVHFEPTASSWHLFCAVFAVIFVAELPDKTAFAALLLATRSRPLGVFLGACAAFVVQSIVAVTAGSLLTALPPALVHRVAGVVFLVFAWSMWRRVRDDEEESLGSGDGSLLQSATGAFMVIFVAEWGDLTQLATATLVARYQQTLIIFVAATLALWAVTGLSVLIGSHLRNAVHPQTFQRIAAVLFAAIGAYILATA